MKKILLLVLTSILILTLGCAGARALKRAERYAERGELDLAVKEYREANKQNPGVIEYRSALLRAEEMAANQHYRKARNFLNERKLDQAVVELQQALFLNSSNAAIQSALKSVLDMKQAEEHYRAALTFIDLGRLNNAMNELNRSVELDPENGKYQDALEKLRKKRETGPEDALTLASDKPITLNFKNTNIKEVFGLLSKLSGVNILFDEEVRARPVTVFVKDVSFQYALNLLLSTNKLFMKKISADSIIIVPKTRTKVFQYQDLMMKTFYLSNVKAKNIVILLRSILDTRKVFVNDTLNSVTVRDTPEKIKLVEKIIAANDLKGSRGHPRRRDPRDIPEQDLEIRLEFLAGALCRCLASGHVVRLDERDIVHRPQEPLEGQHHAVASRRRAEPAQAGFRCADAGEPAGARFEQQEGQVPYRRPDPGSDLDGAGHGCGHRHVRVRIQGRGHQAQYRADGAPEQHRDPENEPGDQHPRRRARVRRRPETIPVRHQEHGHDHQPP